MDRREFLIGGGVSIAAGSVFLTQWLKHTGFESANKDNQIVLEILALTLLQQGPSGAIEPTAEGQPNLYISASLVAAAKKAKIDLASLRVQGNPTLVDYFTSHLRDESLGSSDATDSITRLRTAWLLGQDLDHRLGETRYLISKRLDAESKELPLQPTSAQSLSYRVYGFDLLNNILGRGDHLLGRLWESLLELQNPEDGGIREFIRGDESQVRSVVDLSAVAYQSGLKTGVGNFLKFAEKSDGWGFYRDSTVNIDSVAAVCQALPGSYSPRGQLISWWEQKGRGNFNVNAALLLRQTQVAYALAS